MFVRLDRERTYLIRRCRATSLGGAPFPIYSLACGTVPFPNLTRNFTCWGPRSQRVK